MKAPDGSPTSLTEEQWLLIRTPEFKNMFGDWETVAELTAHVMNSREEGLLQAKKLWSLSRARIYKIWKQAFFAVVNSIQANELVSLRTRDRSTRNGFTAEEHFAAVANIKNLWKHAYALGSHGDLKFKDNRGVERVTDPSLTILRFVAPVRFPSGAGPAYLTLKQRSNEGNRLYSLELTDIKKLNAYSSALSETAGIARSLSFEKYFKLL